MKDLKDLNYSAGGARLIGGLPLLIIMTLDGNSGIDLLDATINWMSALTLVG